jgi:hypothetical protein
LSCHEREAHHNVWKAALRGRVAQDDGAQIQCEIHACACALYSLKLADHA